MNLFEEAEGLFDHSYTVAEVKEAMGGAAFDVRSYENGEGWTCGRLHGPVSTKLKGVKIELTDMVGRLASDHGTWILYRPGAGGVVRQSL